MGVAIMLLSSMHGLCAICNGVSAAPTTGATELASLRLKTGETARAV